MLLVLIFFPLRNDGGDPMGDGGSEPVGEDTYRDFRLPRLRRRQTLLQRSILLLDYEIWFFKTNVFDEFGSDEFCHCQTAFNTQKMILFLTGREFSVLLVKILILFLFPSFQFRRHIIKSQKLRTFFQLKKPISCER
jgi:hypothetical protein